MTKKAQTVAADQQPDTDTGHDNKGRFTAGNKCSRGRRVTELRRALLDAVSPDDIKEIVGQIVAKAKQGDMQAISLLLDRCIGKAMTAQEYELFTHEYDREDFVTDPMAITFDDPIDQIRPLRLKA